MDDCYRRYYANIHPRRLRDRRGSDGGVRGGAQQGRPVRQRPPSGRDHLRPQRHGSHQPRRLCMGPCEPRRRRRGRPVAHGASRQRRPLAHARRGTWGRAALDPAHRRLPARSLGPRRAARRREAAGDQRHVQRARHDQHDSAARRRRTRTARWSSSTPVNTFRTSARTCSNGTPTSAFSAAAARSERHRRALGVTSFSMRCRPSWAEAR